MAHKNLLRVGVILVVLLVAAAGVGYWYYLRIFVSTDDAYVSGHVGVVSARVPGRVAQVLVDNNQPVTAGQVLLTLEPQDFEVAVAQAEATLNRLRQDLAAQYARVAAARAKILQSRAHLDQALTDQRRYSSLYERRTVPRQTLDQVNTRVKVAQGELAEAQAEERQALAAIGGSTDIPLEEQPAIREAKARLEEARLRLSYTQVKAGVTGYITRRQVKPGNWVQPGQPLMMVVPLEFGDLWIEANYKETQLTHVCIGQKAKVTVDTYPGVTFTGVVDSIMAGTGAAFALLPPENATGNWVKVVQRIPVKIRLLPPFPEDRPLRLGMSCYATIDTRDRSGPRLLAGGGTGGVREPAPRAPLAARP
jgi:membrane fusion protein (multidrug efflux system)